MMKTRNKLKIPYVLVGPVIVLVVMLIWYAVGGIYPFGSSSSASVDGISQTLVFFSELSQKIKSGSSLFFSWHIGGGTNFWTIISYYLVSPLNLITLFFKPENMDKAFSIIILLIPPLEALTFGIYLKNVYKKNDLSVAIFSVLWSLGAFSLVSMNLVEIWSNALIWFPLVIMGLHRMMEGKSAWQYSLFLGLTIVSNFYIGWMVCIFCVLYFVYLFIIDDNVVYEGTERSIDDEEKEENESESNISVFETLSNSYLLGSITKFVLSSLLAGGIAAIVVMPILSVISVTGKGTVTSEAINVTGDGIWGILASFVTPLPMTVSGLLSKDFFYVFVGIGMLILMISYFFNKGISGRKKIGAGLLVAVFVASVIFFLPRFIWHGFGEPAGVAYRFAFLLSFVIIKLAYEAYLNIDKSTLAGILVGVGFAGICTAAIGLNVTVKESVFSQKLIITTVVIIIAYTVLFLLMSKKTTMKKTLTYILLICVVGETFILNKENILAMDLEKTLGEYQGVNQFLDRGQDYDRYTFSTNVNDYNDILMYGGLFGFNSYESYSSMSDYHYTLTLSYLGTYGNGLNLQNGGREQTPIFNMLFPSKYYIDATGHLTDNRYRKLIDEKNGYRLFENNYTTPFMFTVSDKIDEWNPLSYPVHIDNLNEATKSVTDTEENVVFYNSPQNFEFENCRHISSLDRIDANGEIPDSDDPESESYKKYLEWREQRMTGYSYEIDDMSKNASVTFESVAETDGMMYLFVYTNEFTDVSVELNGRKIDVFAFGKTNDTNYELGEVKKGDVAKITIGGHRDRQFSNGDLYGIKNGWFTALSFTVDMDKFEKAYQKLDSMSDTEMLEFSDTYVKAKVTSYEDGILYIPTAYDEGWTITIDGEEVPLYEHESHILMTEITKGEHIVEMKYCPQGFKAGVAITGASIAILIAWAVISKKRNDKFATNNVNEE